MNKCRCLIADDHPIVRRGVRELLEEEQLSSEICEVRTGEEALEAVRRQAWDVMILDIALPDKHGLEVLKETKRLVFLRGIVEQGETKVGAFSVTIRKGRRQ